MSEYVEHEAAKSDEYIKREYALKALEWTWAGKAAFDNLKAIPAEDVVPVRHGKWLPVGEDDMDEDVYRCSECGVEQFFPGSLVDNFCPNCGASMKDDDGE